MDWLTDELKLEIRKVFEPRYGRALNDEEVVEIAENLVGATEVMLKVRWREYADVYASVKVNAS